jgi:hypothetical protein
LIASLITTKPNQEYIYILGLPLEFWLGLFTIVAAVYAARLFISSRRSNELKTVPTLIIKYKSSPNSRSSMELVNLTDKIAYNITIDPLFLRNKFDGCLYKVNFAVMGENYINPNQSRPLAEHKMKDGAKDEENNFADIVGALGAAQNYPIVVRFTDMQGVKYFIKVNFERGAEKIVQSPMKLTYYRRISLWVKAYKRYRTYRINQSRRFARVHPDLDASTKEANKLEKLRIDI